MKSIQPSTEALLTEITALRQEVSELQRQKSELELLLEMTAEHSDGVAADLQQEVQDTQRESAERFEVLTNTVPVPILVSRLAGDVIVYANRSANELMGVARGELLGRGVCEFYHDAVERQQILGLVDKRGFLNHWELQGQRETQGYFWAAVFIRPFTFNAQPCLLEVYHDLTERKRAERERDRFTNQLHAAADLAQQINAILDPDLLLQEVVTQLQDCFDLYQAQVYLLDEDTDDLVLQAGSGEAGRLRRQQNHNIPLDYKHSLVARAARSRTLVLVNDTAAEPDFMPSPLLPDTRSELSIPLLAGGRLLGVFDVQQDQAYRFTSSDRNVFSTIAGQITTALENASRFEQTQARLRISQELIGAQTEEQVLDAMLQAVDVYPGARISILTLDPIADERTFILRRDEPFESGLSPLASLETRFPASQTNVPRLTAADEPLFSANVFQDERTDEAAREIARRSGGVSVAILPIAAGGEWLGTIMGLSKQERYFDKRKQPLYRALADQGAIFLRTARFFDQVQETAQRLRELDRLKSEFMASMSHELRTPLNSIIGFAEVLLMGISGDLPTEALVDVQAIFDNGQHLLGIINDVLDMAKIEAGTLALKISPVDIALLLTRVQANNAALAADKAIAINIEVEDDLPRVQADPARLYQVLDNLLSNACKFTDAGAVTLRAFRDGDQLCLQVRDSGIGIAAKDIDTIFERFRQLDGSHARRAGGIGLGLPITRHLVELHGGKIKVRSELGKGSVFSVYLKVID
jgi:PAS domain S-box-containing protein